MPRNDLTLRIGAKDNTKAGVASAKKSITKFAASFVGAAGLAMAMGKVLSIGSKFEQSMKTLKVLAGANAKEFAALEKKARTLGATMSFTATESAVAMQEFARAGFTAVETIEAIDGALMLAAATGADMQQATGIMSNTVKQFGLDASDTAKMADIYTFAVNNSKLTMESLTMAMKFAGPVGNAFGMSVEETTAAVAAFADAGLDATMAGTAMRRTMIEAGKASDKKDKVLRRLGLTMNDINPEMNSFADIVTKVGEAGIGATDAMVVFGTRSGANIASLSAQIAEGKADIEGFSKKLVDVGDVAAESTKEMLDTVQGDWKIFLSALQERAIQTFDAIKPAIRVILEGFKEIVSGTALIKLLFEDEATAQKKFADATSRRLKDIQFRSKQIADEEGRRHLILDRLSSLEEERDNLLDREAAKLIPITEAEKVRLERVKFQLNVQNQALQSLDEEITKHQKIKKTLEEQAKISHELSQAGPAGPRKELKPGVAPRRSIGSDSVSDEAAAEQKAKLALEALRESARQAEMLFGEKQRLYESFVGELGDVEARSLASRLVNHQNYYTELLENQEINDETRLLITQELNTKLEAEELASFERLKKLQEKAAEEAGAIKDKLDAEQTAMFQNVAGWVGLGENLMSAIHDGMQKYEDETGAERAKRIISSLLGIAASAAAAIPGFGSLVSAGLGVASAAVGTFHDGGRKMPGRAHSGANVLGNDEGMAILQDYEGILNNDRGMAAAGGPIGLHQMNQFGASPGGSGGTNIQAWDTRSLKRHYRDVAQREMIRLGEYNQGLLGRTIFKG